MMDLKSISIYKNGSTFFESISKDTIVIAGNKPGVQFPIAYILKPKGITNKFWSEIKEKIQIQLLK